MSLTMSKQFGHISQITSKALRLARQSDEDVIFEFNGVEVRVSKNTKLDCHEIADRAILAVKDKEGVVYV